ncbi:MAG: 3'(2'),5'-bisphosphate nucleotidase CysQ [Buchnera aphidicola (Eriosoma harunire)]
MFSYLSSLIRTAGASIRKIYFNTVFKDVSYKIDKSPVTEADMVAHEIIVNGLEKLTPGVPILSEENYSKTYDYSYWNEYWLVDPLDGTKEFINNNHQFTVNIALIKQGIPILGFIYVPVFDTLYYSINGLSWKITKEKKKIQVNNLIPPTICISKSHSDERVLNFINTFEDSKIVKAGSSIKFCWLAEGKIQLYPRFGPTAIWDTAAGHVILVNAGGYVRNIHDQKSLDYTLSLNNYLNAGFIASSS